MKFAAILLACILATSAGAAEKKPGAKKPKAKKSTAEPAKPQKSIGDLALDEAKKADENKDGKISGTEVTTLRAAYSRNPKSWLYIYDGNGNRFLEDTEIAAIRWGAASEKTSSQNSAEPEPGKKKKKKKK